MPKRGSQFPARPPCWTGGEPRDVAKRGGEEVVRGKTNWEWEGKGQFSYSGGKQTDGTSRRSLRGK